jgi:NAD(P)-dependent dehydrogenase (short-subunit alcohol dehydrogenase family)
MRAFRDRLALVTGAGSGIGRAIAFALAGEGAALVLVDIDPARLAETADALRGIGTRVAAQVADMGSECDVEHLVDGVLRRWGGLDILVNNAGIALYGLTEHMTDRQWNRLLDVNLHGPILLVRRLLPALVARPEAHILNVCSLAGLVGVPRLAAYQVSKFGLIGFSESLRAEYGRRGLGVTALCPGLVRTDIFRKTETTPGRSLPKLPAMLHTSPERVARRALCAMRRNEGVVVVTLFDQLAWGIKRWLPGMLDRVQRFRWHAQQAAIATPLVDRFVDCPTVHAGDATVADDEPVNSIIPFDAARRRAA